MTSYMCAEGASRETGMLIKGFMRTLVIVFRTGPDEPARLGQSLQGTSLMPSGISERVRDT